jgi:hypothetical protein
VQVLKAQVLQAQVLQAQVLQAQVMLPQVLQVLQAQVLQAQGFQAQVFQAQVLQVLQTKIDFWQLKLNKYCTNFVQICMQIYARPVSNKLDCVTVTLNVWFVNKTT